jgi:hypothetical protein
MTLEELVTRLRGLIGQKVSIQSSLVHSPAGAILKDVTVVDGRVWVHAEDGISWVVDARTAEIEVEDVDGTGDFSSIRGVGEKVTEFRERYGLKESELRRVCRCYVCEGKRVAKEDERGEKLRDGYVSRMGCEPESVVEVDWRHDALEIREREVIEKNTDMYGSEDGQENNPFASF